MTNASYRIEGIIETCTSPLEFTHAVVGEYDQARSFERVVGAGLNPACWQYICIEGNEQNDYVAFIREVMTLSVMGRERDGTLEALHWAQSEKEAAKEVRQWSLRGYRNVRVVPVQPVSA